jgi:hypothetical protein
VQVVEDERKKRSEVEPDVLWRLKTAALADYDTGVTRLLGEWTVGGDWWTLWTVDSDWMGWTGLDLSGQWDVDVRRDSI